MSDNTRTATSASGNEDYSDQEKKLIKSIIACQQSLTDATKIIGECCDKLVKMNNGIQYGDRTLKRIASYPGINCSEFHLRRCWNYHRLMNDKDYQGEDFKDLKALSKTPSIIYQLARIFNSKWLSEEKKISLIKEIAKIAVGKKTSVAEETSVASQMSVNHVAVWVSLKLEIEEGRMGKKEEESEKHKKPTAIINEKNLEQVANSIQKVVKSPLLLKEAMGNEVVRHKIFKLMNEGMNYIEKMPDYYHDNETAKAITDLLARLSGVATRMKVG